MVRFLAAASLMLVVLASSAMEPADALTIVGGTANWTFVGAPRVTTIGVFSAAETTFHNNLDVQVLGIVVMVVHNRIGQTVSYSTATLNLTRGFSGVAYTVETGLPIGIYNATIFAFSMNGVAISNSTTISFLGR